MAFKDTVLTASLGRVTIRVGAVDLTVEILPAAFNTTIPFFVGRIDDDHYFISDAVPEKFQFAVMTHEANCLALKACGREGHCIMALQEEMKHVPATDVPEYKAMRIAMFKGLLEHLSQGPQTPFIDEVKGTLTALHVL